MHLYAVDSPAGIVVFHAGLVDSRTWMWPDDGCWVDSNP